MPRASHRDTYYRRNIVPLLSKLIPSFPTNSKVRPSRAVSKISRPSSTDLNKYNGLSRVTFYRRKTKQEIAEHERQKKRAFDEIEKQGDISLLACEYCYKHGLQCIIIEGRKSTKCASYSLKGIKCVNVTWTSLDKTREEAKAKINKDL